MYPIRQRVFSGPTYIKRDFHFDFSAEELGWTSKSFDSSSSNQRKPSPNGSSGQQNGQPRLRDRLCLLIRQYQLDAGLVKAYAVDFCKTPSLRDASREQVEACVAERRVESCRRDLLDHIIAVNERHLKRLLSEYVRYYHEDRTHLGLRKETLENRIPSLFGHMVRRMDLLSVPSG